MAGSTGDDVLVAVPVYGRLDLTVTCLAALDATTPGDVEVLVVDDCGPQRVQDADVAQALSGSGRAWRVLRNDRNLGYVASANQALHLAGDRDVVLVNSDVRVFPGWFEAFGRAVQAFPGAASVTALGDRASVVSVPVSADPEPVALGRLAALHPVAVGIPVAVGHCTRYRRDAVARVGGFDPAFSPGYGEEVDWSLRARRHGFCHVVALGAYVRHGEGASFGRGRRREWLRRRHEARLAVRYPKDFVAIRRGARDPDSLLRQALAAAGEALRSGSDPVERAQ